MNKVCGFKELNRRKEGKEGKDTGSLFAILFSFHLTVFVHFGIATLQWPALWVKYLYLGIFTPSPTSNLKDCSGLPTYYLTELNTLLNSPVRVCSVKHAIVSLILS